MLSTTRGLTARHLIEYGEDEAAQWVGSSSNEDFMKVCGVANWLISYGPESPSGSSMMMATAIAAAAVFVKEGVARDLARKRRKKLPDLPADEYRKIAFDGSPDLNEQRRKGEFYGVTNEFKEFWTRSRS